ncbi:MAG: zinc ribbon domain-containing protein [Deltaproteobacteria bacterium]
MAVYEYEHVDKHCAWGRVFEVEQSMHDEPFTRCPNCGQPVRKLISPCFVNRPKTNTELRDMGFTKLVRRDSGPTASRSGRPTPPGTRPRCGRQ